MLTRLVGAVVGALLLVVDEAVGRVTGFVVSLSVGTVFVTLWFVLPAFVRRSGPLPDELGAESFDGGGRVAGSTARRADAPASSGPNTGGPSARCSGRGDEPVEAGHTGADSGFEPIQARAAARGDR